MEKEELNVKLKRYSELHELTSKMEKEMEELKKEIKTHMINNSLKTMPFNGKTFVLQQQDRSKVDEDVMVNVIKEYLLNMDENTDDAIILKQCIRNKEVPDGDAIKNAIAQGLLSMNDVAKATISNVIDVLKLEKPKAKK